MTRIKVDIWIGPLHQELLAETLHDSWDTAGPTIRDAVDKGQLANVLLDEVLTVEEELLLGQDDPAQSFWGMALETAGTVEAALELVMAAADIGAAVQAGAAKRRLN